MMIILFESNIIHPIKVKLETVFRIEFEFFNDLPNRLLQSFKALLSSHKVMFSIVYPLLYSSWCRVSYSCKSYTLNSKKSCSHLFWNCTCSWNCGSRFFCVLDIGRSLKIWKRPNIITTIHEIDSYILTTFFSEFDHIRFMREAWAFDEVVMMI